MLLENTLKELNPVIIVVNENLLIRIKYIKAWPGKIEISYFLFTVCWDLLRAFGTSTADFLLIEKRQNTVTFQKIRQSAGNQK